MGIQEFLRHFESVKQTGPSQWTARCPAHDDRVSSLSITANREGIGIYCHAGCSTESVVDAVGLTKKDLFFNHRESRPHIAATYDYTDENGELLFQVLRKKPKAFVQRKPDGNGNWVYNLNGVRRIPYRLPDLLKADQNEVIFIVEGEKDADKLRSLGLTATCNPGGVGKWRSSYNGYFRSRDVVILPDNDEPGRKHAEQVRESLAAIARSVTVVQLPGLGPKQDISDWLKDHDKDDLLALIKRARVSDTGAPDEAVTTSTADYHRTDYGNALRLIAQHGKDLRYSFQRGRWLVWNGEQWAWDQAGQVTGKAKDAVRAVYSAAANAEDSGERRALALWASRSESEARLRAMISLARDEVPVLLEDLDQDPWLLNVANGTLDLRTGELRPHRREDLITKLAPVKYDPSAKCSLWKKFLDRTFDGDEELIGFVQRAVGYALTGSTREQVLFMLYGTGANGKSTFLETLRAMLGDYAQHSDFSTFIARNVNGPRNDIARLNGARFVSAQEIQSGQRLDERLVKQLTGGDTVTARFLYGENFEFRPTFKLFLAANHKPVIRGTDHAIWRRIRLIPFTVTIPDEEQDKDLAQKLQGELPGILAWAVQGCLQWQREGLAAPAQVTEATKSYQAEMDTLGGFLEEKCVINKLVEAKAKDLYRAYVDWCSESGEKPTSQRRFGTALTERGFQKEKTRSGIVYTGIGLLDVNDRRFTSFTETDPGNTHYKDSVHDVNDCDPFSKKSLMRENKKKVSEKGVQSSTRCTTRNGSPFAEPGFGDEGDLSSSPDRPYTQAPDNEDLPPF